MDFEGIAAKNAIIAREDASENLREGELVRCPKQLPFWPDPERSFEHVL